MERVAGGCGAFGPSTHTHYKTSRECAKPRSDIRSLATNHAIVRAHFYSTSSNANGTHERNGKITYDSTSIGGKLPPGTCLDPEYQVLLTEKQRRSAKIDLKPSIKDFCY